MLQNQLTRMLIEYQKTVCAHEVSDENRLLGIGIAIGVALWKSTYLHFVRALGI